MNQQAFHVLGLIFGTFVLLAFSLALYDLFVQIATITNLFDTAKTTTLTWRQIFGQFIFVVILFIIGFAVLYYFRPYGEKGTFGEERALRDADIIRNSGISAFADITQPAMRMTH